MIFLYDTGEPICPGDDDFTDAIRPFEKIERAEARDCEEMLLLAMIETQPEDFGKRNGISTDEFLAFDFAFEQYLWAGKKVSTILCSCGKFNCSHRSKEIK